VNLPVFPLNTVLFPGGVIPLQVFEVRYLNMVKRCNLQREPFVIASLADGDEVQKPDSNNQNTFEKERFYPFGTLAHIEQMQTIQSGLVRIVCRGGQRVHLDRCEKGPLGLWVADAGVIEDDQFVTIPSELSHIGDALADVLIRLNAEHPNITGVVAPPAEGAEEWENAGWVANRWAELLPLPNELKVKLLTVESPLVRLELIGDQLDEFGLGH